jgi:hypothetical protein
MVIALGQFLNGETRWVALLSEVRSAQMDQAVPICPGSTGREWLLVSGVAQIIL